MIYARLTVFSKFSAYVTADDEEGFRDELRKVIEECLRQYETEYGQIAVDRKNRIGRDMDALKAIPLTEMQDFSYDLRIDGTDFVGQW
jgi:hypothetical protein